MICMNYELYFELKSDFVNMSCAVHFWIVFCKYFNVNAHTLQKCHLKSILTSSDLFETIKINVFKICIIRNHKVVLLWCRPSCGWKCSNIHKRPPTLRLLTWCINITVSVVARQNFKIADWTPKSVVWRQKNLPSTMFFHHSRFLTHTYGVRRGLVAVRSQTLLSICFFLSWSVTLIYKLHAHI